MDTIKIRINQIALELGYKEEDLPEMLSKRLNCKVTDLNEIKLVRRSIDARSRQSAPHYVVSVELSFSGSQLPKNVNDNVTIIKEPLEEPRIQLSPDKKLNGTRPIIVGAGPAGLMAALSLAEAGLRPLLIERGAAVEERTKQVFQFGKNGIFNEESNILFGEGGAGLFSDGKLTSRSKDRPRVKRFLESLVRCGAPRSILIDSEPHIGSDVLVKIVPRLRQLIIDSGGEVQFNSCLEQLFINKGQLQAIQVSGQNLPTQACILATGHSARDIFRMLASAGLPLEAKSFAMGVRVEIPQVKINQTQWHEWANHPHLGAASFRVTQKEQAGSRSCYSFCMCPGGLVIACASSFGKITTNGMSLSARDELFANAAFLVPVRPEDITATGSVEPPILDSFKYQEVIEEKAFILGGGNFALPASRLTDFLQEKIPVDLPEMRSNQRSVPVDLRELLPGYICRTLSTAIPRMLKKLGGISLDEVILYGPETRSSSPIRIVRGKDGHSTGLRGLFPCGEGAGYAGGIVSSSIDGLRASNAVMDYLVPNILSPASPSPGKI